MFGKIAILAGDAGYEGAGILASAGALSVGAGLVRLLSQENAVPLRCHIYQNLWFLDLIVHKILKTILKVPK